MTEVVRLMIHDDAESGVYLFAYNTLKDASSVSDEWFETVAMAEEAAEEKYKVASNSWNPLPDLHEHCQSDWIEPVRVKGRVEGQPQWGHFEKLVNNKWVDLLPTKP
ncbi:hypothetical protein LRS06_06890 [Hymenobacter sp. J193]|uniref:hypothetical protein n=1 Tax=Hymenobacter sp. J193 TaxID=2898429 RepID=UPI00215191FD|nr:hypothetical protein [Hymenobacter sp. J193]MCR5887512.1 hypothetical protein [Hymenobacter sp. J193]